MGRNIFTQFRNIGRPNPLVAIIDKETEKLQERHPRIRGFSVTVDRPNKRRLKGDQIRAQVLVFLPKRRLYISKEADGMTEADNAAVALANAFDATEHVVDSYLKRHRLSSWELTASEGISPSEHRRSFGAMTRHIDTSGQGAAALSS